MKLKTVFLLVCFVFVTNVQMQANRNDFAFRAGERLEYNVFFNWGFVWMNAARSNLMINESTHNRKPVYNLSMTTETVRAFSLFYFKDSISSYVNRNTLLPYFTCQASHESNFFAIDTYTFHQTTSPWQVTVERQTPRNLRDTLITTDQPYFDLLSTLYRLRNIDRSTLRENQRIPMPMVFNDGTHDLQIRFAGREQIRLRNGKTYNTLVFKPTVAEGKLFEGGERMTIWISDDENRIPVKIESRLRVGSIRAMLVSAENTAHPMTSEVTTTNRRR